MFASGAACYAVTPGEVGEVGLSRSEQENVGACRPGAAE